MDLTQRLEADLTEATKARDEITLQVLRLLKAALKNHSIELRQDLSPQEALQILQKEAKKRQEAIQQYSDANRQDLVQKESAELQILERYLPEQPSEAEVRAAAQDIIREQKLSGQSAMGQLISGLKDHFDGLDGSLAAKVAREELL
ncbi:GatB/YqeY domain-containing protein [bacterium]|nr:GatB/YqeY domain-containing protein [bacterium]